MRIALALAAATLAACASKAFQVQDFGPGTYVVLVNSRFPLRAQQAAIQTANAHCAEQHKALQPEYEQQVGKGWRLQFRCIDP